MKVIGYCRVSTQNQVGEDKFGFESQEQDIIKYCEENDLELVDVVKEQISGAKDNRPLFNDILYGDDGLAYEGVIVAKIDRISRKIEDYFGFKYILSKRNVKLISANQNEEFEKMGIFASVYEALISTFAELERQRINERMSGGRIVKAKTGSYSGGKAPFGYHIENGELVIDEQEKTIVELIFDLKAKGLGYSAIARELEEQGFKTRNGGTKWQPKTVQRILGNSVYTGVYHYSGIEVQGTHQTFIK